MIWKDLPLVEEQDYYGINQPLSDKVYGVVHELEGITGTIVGRIDRQWITGDNLMLTTSNDLGICTQMHPSTPQRCSHLQYMAVNHADLQLVSMQVISD